MRPKAYQAVVGGVTVTLALLFVASRLYAHYRQYNHDPGLSIFNGKLPPVPQYKNPDRESPIPSSPNLESEQAHDPTSAHADDTDPSPVLLATATTASVWESEWSDETTWPSWSNGAHPTQIAHDEVDKYVYSIMDFRDEWPFKRISCPSDIGSRYEKLKEDPDGSGKARYFFALNLVEAAHILPRLMSSIVEAMRYLGPARCAISIVAGASEDGTWDILAALKPRIDEMGAQFFLATGKYDADSSGPGTFAKLRNKALEPLRAKGVEPVHALSAAYSPDAVIIFLDDIALCPEDILELVFQHVNQGAHMSCAFDWVFNGTVFHDIWDSRSLGGNTFFEIPHDGSLKHKDDMFFDDAANQHRYEKFQPLQVYSCWGGMVTLDAASFAEGTVGFRSTEQTDSDCYTGEATLLAKDLFASGLGRILAVPSVNVAYSNDEALGTKHTRGYVSDHVNVTSSVLDHGETVQWQQDPPDLIKCLPLLDDISWTEWTQPE